MPVSATEGRVAVRGNLDKGVLGEGDGEAGGGVDCGGCCCGGRGGRAQDVWFVGLIIKHPADDTLFASSSIACTLNPYAPGGKLSERICNPTATVGLALSTLTGFGISDTAFGGIELDVNKSLTSSPLSNGLRKFEDTRIGIIAGRIP